MILNIIDRRKSEMSSSAHDISCLVLKIASRVAFVTSNDLSASYHGKRYQDTWLYADG